MPRIFLCLVLVFGPTLYYLYHSSTEDLVQELITASQKNDISAMADRFSWAETREATADDIKSKKRVLGSYGRSIGPPLGKIDDIVEYYIRPENIKIAYDYHDRILKNIDEEEFIRSMGFVAPWGFEVTLGYPLNYEGELEIDPVLKEQLKATFVFRLDGLTWKVHEIQLPIFMVPHQTYQRPAVERFKF